MFLTCKIGHSDMLWTPETNMTNITSDLLKTHPKDYAAQIHRIHAHLALGRLDEVNAALLLISPKRGQLSSTALRLGHIPSVRPLPSVKEVKPFSAREAPSVVRPTLCKAFALPLLKSIAAVSPGLAVHIHVVGNDPGTVKVLQRVNLAISITTEDPASYIAATGIVPQQYFGAVRLIRFTELMERSGATLVLMDVDALAKNDCRRLFKIPGDLAMRVRAGRLEIHNQFSACMIKATPAALPYLRAVSRIMGESISNPWWGVDQFALLSAYLALKPISTLIGPKEADIGDYTRDSIIWFTAGTAKRGLASGWPVSDQDPVRYRYSKWFRA